MLRYLDIFAGAGGLSEGFIRAGFDPVAHVEMDKAACFTLKTRVAYHYLKDKGKISIYEDYLNGGISRDELYANIPSDVLDSVIEAEISDSTFKNICDCVDSKLAGNKLDLIVGGPPCQAYSLIGRARDENGMKGDSRNDLYLQYAKFLQRYQPEYFVFENVVGLLSAKDEAGNLYLDKMTAKFRECGYSVEYNTLDARDYGVLQNRRRIILIGKKGIDETGFYPAIEKIPTSSYKIRDLFDDLPSIHSGEGQVRPFPVKPTASGYLIDASIKTPDETSVTFHIARPHNEKDLEIYRMAVDNWNKNKARIRYDKLPERLQTHEKKDIFTDRFKVVAGDLPFSQTIVAHLGKDGHYFIHPDIEQNRSLTPREAARIQTFPDDYYFESKTGKASLSTVFKQIGNAVPVRLAEQIAKALKHCC